MPSKFVQPGRIYQLAGGAVGLSVVVGDGAIVTNDVLNEGGEGVDGEVLTDTDVKDAVGGGVAEGVLRVFKDEEDSICQVVHVQEFALGRAAAPERDGRVGAVGRGALRLVKLAEQGGQDVTRLEVEVVVRTVEVGRHQREEIVAMLPMVGLA